MFGNLKNEAVQGFRRGVIRVVGLAKTSVMTTFAAVAFNIKLAQRVALERAAAPTVPVKTVRKRGPRPRTERLRAALEAALGPARARRDLATGQSPDAMTVRP